MATEISNFNRNGGPAGREEVKARKKYVCAYGGALRSQILPVL